MWPVPRLPDVRATGRIPLIAGLAVVAATVAGCTSSGHHELLTASGPPGKPYNGPLHVPIGSTKDTASVLDRSGAAGRVLDCRYPPYGGGQGVYDDGLTDVESSYVDAAEEFIGPNNDGGTLPSTGYRVERSAGNRVLLTFDVRGRTKVAIILRNGITDYRDEVGWGVETWAACDPAEFPAATIAALDLGVWQDRGGRPAPLARVESYPGQGWCDYAGVTFVQTGGYPHEQVYVRDTDHQLTRYLRLAYDGDAALPPAAVDSGYHRDGRELWFGADDTAVYLVSLTDKTDVERWPAVKPGVGCG